MTWAYFIMKFFRTWIDWWLFVPLSLILAIGSYWFVPYLIGEYGLMHIITGRFIPETNMQYTGTAWFYDWFKSLLIFFTGTGAAFLAYRWYYSKIHKYHESELFDIEFISQPSKFRIITSLAIPAILFIGYCIICLAAFK